MKVGIFHIEGPCANLRFCMLEILSVIYLHYSWMVSNNLAHIMTLGEYESRARVTAKSLYVVELCAYFLNNIRS